MNPIFSSLNSGYSPEQILGFLSKMMPGLNSKIGQATRNGYNSKQILGFLSKTFETENRENLSESQRHAVNQRADSERTKHGLKMAATAIAAPLAASATAGALRRALPASLTAQVPGSPSGGTPAPTPAQGVIPPTNNTLGANQAPSPTPNISPNISPQQPPTPQIGLPEWLKKNQSQSASPQAPNIPTSLPQAPNISQALNPQRDLKKSVDILKNLGQDGAVKNMLEGGMPAKDVAGVLKTITPKDKLKALEAQEGGLETLINDYAEEMQQPTQEQAPMEPAGQELDAVTSETERAEEVSEPKPIEKNQTVSTAQGIGEVKEIRNGKAIVEVDGKKHQVNEEDIEPTLFSDEDIAQKYDELMSAIPEEHRSGFISWAGYDEDTNEIGFIPRGGKYEILKNITPEEAKKIKEGKGVARTTGANREGLWVQGEDTRGGVISQIIHDRRKKNKAEEDKQLKLNLNEPKREKEDRGMKPLFDEMQYAREKSRERELKKKMAAKEKQKREKEEEKSRLKREKDEAKKRKKQA